MSFGRQVVNIEKTALPFATLKAAKAAFKSWERVANRFTFGRTGAHSVATSWGWQHTGWDEARRCEVRYDGKCCGYIAQTEDGWVVRDYYGN